MKCSKAVVAVALSAVVAGAAIAADPPRPHPVDAHNVVWTTRAKGPADSMPLGNGFLGMNLWVEDQGDLVFYLSRNDSFSEISQLCKVGRIRVSLQPNPFAAGNPFRQELRLRDGVCEIQAGPEGRSTRLELFFDPNEPVLHLTGKSDLPVSVTARIESWRTEAREVSPQSAWTLTGSPNPIIESADHFPEVSPELSPDTLCWYHRNDHSLAFDETVRIQSLEPIRDTLHNPLIHRTFGGWVLGPGLVRQDAKTLVSAKPATSFQLRIASPCEQTRDAAAWMELANTAGRRSADPDAALRASKAYWSGFWDRSWVQCDVPPGLEVPPHNGPIRIGVDSDGQNRFPGEIGAVRVTGGPVGASEIASSASAAPQVTPSPTPDLPDLRNGVSISAWVRPDALRSGRIIDHVTAGKPDGFLLDVQDGGVLRMIVGDLQCLSPAGVLKPGDWQHVAATYDARCSGFALYVNGRSVAKLRSLLCPTGVTQHGLFKGQKRISPDISSMTVGKAHTLQRFMQACAGRSIYPIKFNGSIFTVEPTPLGQQENPDWRRWGDCHWWQNIRMPYHAMQASGDFDLMLPLFGMFERIRPFAEARAKLYHNAEGCYFAETMTIWGTYANRDYGWDRAGKQPNEVDCKYWRYAWNQGLELTALMLDYYDHTRDEAFLRTRALPMAMSVLAYFDSRFPKSPQGTIRHDPTQAVETYWDNVINDTPSVSGLHDVVGRIAGLPAGMLTEEQAAKIRRMKSALPPVPIESATLNGRQVQRIAVAESYNPKRSNCENPELFPIWPFRLFGLARPHLEEARHAYLLRGSHNDVGWGYDGNAAALLGMTDEAARIMKVRLANANANYRWPATWGPNFDWLPDQCQGGNLMACINYMLMQHSGDQILLFPAWPSHWDVSFKLHAPNNTVVEATLKNGTLDRLVVTPAERKKDIVLPEAIRPGK